LILNRDGPFYENKMAAIIVFVPIISIGKIRGHHTYFFSIFLVPLEISIEDLSIYYFSLTKTMDRLCH